MAYEVYRILELSPSASIKEIKRSYSQLVRKYKNEDIEKFSLIRRAYEMLINSDAKAIYDSFLQIDSFLKIYQETFLHLEWEEAIQILKRIVVESPEEDEIQKLAHLLPQDKEVIEEQQTFWGYIQENHRFIKEQLGLCYISSGQWDEAIAIYEKLTTQKPEIFHYWTNLGQAYKTQADFLSQNNISQAHLYQQARECFKKAVNLEATNSKPYLEIARIYFNENSYSQAEIWAERAINADRKIDFQDFDAFCFLCLVYAKIRELNKIEELVQKIKILIPNEDAKIYASSKFIEHGDELYRIASEKSDFFEEADFSEQLYLFSVSLTFFKAAKNFNLHDDNLQKKYDKIDKLISVLNQFQKLKNDSLILDSYKKLVVLSLSDYMSIDNYIKDKDDQINLIFVEIITLSKSSINESIERFKSYYADIYNLNIQIFDKLEQSKTTQSFVALLQNRASKDTAILREEINHIVKRLYNFLPPIAEKVVLKYPSSEEFVSSFMKKLSNRITR
ncbi:J domain-containing protein [Nostoc sp. ChiVER01]|uniref:J domain-containing protein n=1 Tax=Nostoc sp. ChiVER01 TaxID=3075382 RepID=UPI002AD5380A|nr:DnaJ domain-containing protein [Nostoc sp. ChiVER01]MDZ8226577.1 DnaJ domain-containing protein [Nostoc sp. ChiVER01]